MLDFRKVNSHSLCSYRESAENVIMKVVEKTYYQKKNEIFQQTHEPQLR